MKKIPDNAKIVFKGVLHDVYHWQQEMFDGTFETFEVLKRRDAITVIAIVGDRIVLNDEEQPTLKFLSLPGGNSETTNLIDDAKRELLEETGYVSDYWHEWFVTDIVKYPKLEWNNHFFIAKNCKKTGEQKLDAGEKIETQLITFEEFLELRNEPKFRNKDLSPILEKAATDNEEQKALRELLGIHN